MIKCTHESCSVIYDETKLPDCPLCQVQKANTAFRADINGRKEMKLLLEVIERLRDELSTLEMEQ